MFRLIVACILLFSGSNVQAQEVTKILFIGNSLTYENNLPELVEEEAATRGLEVKTRMIAKPNYAIIDHWKEGKIQELIKAGNFQFVIVQQGPSSQAEGRKMMIEDGGKIARLCAEYNAKLCFYMVWPSLLYYHTYDDVIKSHQMAAQQNDAILIPVGQVWKKHFDKTEDFSYYGPDGFHPSEQGSKIAAGIIIETLFSY